MGDSDVEGETQVFFFNPPSGFHVAPCGLYTHKIPTQVSGPNGEWDLDLHGTWQKPVPKYTRGGAGIFTQTPLRSMV